jgi:hypothetical protein
VVAETAVRSLSLFLAALLALAIAHKLQLLRTGRAATQPLVKSHGLRGSRAALALSLALIAGAAVVTALVVSPELGLPATAALLVLYAFELRRLAAQETCGCFGEWLAASRRAQAIRRNLALGALAAAGIETTRTERWHGHIAKSVTTGLGVTVSVAGEERYRRDLERTARDVSESLLPAAP